MSQQPGKDATRRDGGGAKGAPWRRGPGGRDGTAVDEVEEREESSAEVGGLVAHQGLEGGALRPAEEDQLYQCGEWTLHEELAAVGRAPPEPGAPHGEIQKPLRQWITGEGVPDKRPRDVRGEPRPALIAALAAARQDQASLQGLG